ncbi:MAG: sensor histidine kinase, partial [Lysobacter sp.]|nr:sensor histidine kinase [Lysobacter sp.]
MHAEAQLPLTTRAARFFARHGFAVAPDSIAAEARRMGRSPWKEGVHLLWSFWVFVTPMMGGRYSWKWLVLTLVSYPVFVALYAKVFVAPRREANRYPVGMALLCFVLMPWYPSAISYYVFGCVMANAGRRAQFLAWFWHWLAFTAVFVALATWIGYPWQVTVWMPIMTVIIGAIVNVERSSEQKDVALRLSQDEVRRLAATAERERIGRDLHDLLGHTLSLITLKLELARKLHERDPPNSLRELEEAERVARHALAEVRSAVTGIRNADLAAELASARLLLESSRVHLEYGAPPT